MIQESQIIRIFVFRSTTKAQSRYTLLTVLYITFKHTDIIKRTFLFVRVNFTVIGFLKPIFAPEIELQADSCC